MEEAFPAIWCAGGDNNLIKNVVIEGDDSNMTYGIKMSSMKGSWIRDCVITRFATSGIWVEGGADQYFIWGGIENNLIASLVASNTEGILVDSQATLVAYGSVIRDNDIILGTGTSSKGIDVNNTGSILVRNNYVSVPTSGTPIEHAGGNGFILGNHTAAGTTIVDPNVVAS
jgi:hypothetical protein